MPKNIRKVLNDFLTTEPEDYKDFLKNLDQLSQEQITKILETKDLLSFLVASNCGDVEYLKSFDDEDLLSHIRGHDYFAFQIAARNNQVKIMKFIDDFVEVNGKEKEGKEMVREDKFLAFVWTGKFGQKNAREYLKQEYPISYKLALEKDKIKPKKKDSEWKLEIHQLDVGQGDSALVLFKKLNQETRKYEVDKSILIDGGLGYQADYINSYVKDKIGNDKALNAIIITHFDADHYLGILPNILSDLEFEDTGRKRFSKAKSRKMIQDGGLLNDNTKFVLSAESDDSSKNFRKELKRLHPQTHIFDSYNQIGKSIWEVIGEQKPENAPDMKFISAENSFEKEQGMSQEDIKQLPLDNDENKRSTVSLIGMGNFRFFTAGDFENSRGLIEHLGSKQNSTEYLPIQAFLAPHHGSKNNFPKVNKLFTDKMQARAALISFGKNYNHPDQETLDTLKQSGVDFVYMTNPIPDIRKSNDKLIRAGEVKTTDAKLRDKKDPKGTIKLQTYQNIANEGEEKFIVKYQNTGSKTRDYFKDKEFGKLRDEIISTITKFDERLGTSYSKDLKEKGQIKILLSKKNLESFLDEERKIKHLNPATLLKFAESYDADKETMSFLKISMKDDFIGLTIRKNTQIQSIPNSTKHLSILSGYDVVGEVRKLETKLGKDKMGFFVTKEEGENLRSGIFEIENLIEKRKKDNFKEGNLFVEVIPPEKGKVAIGFNLWEAGSVSKEYHKSQRENPDTKTHKVVARRIEYGNNNNRTIS